MAESARDLLRREFAEQFAGTRASWSARAVVQANRILRSSVDREGRRLILVAELGIDQDGDGLWYASEEIRQLESRAWLLDHFLTEAERERELAQIEHGDICRWCENPAPSGELCSRCRGTVAGERARLADQSREHLAEIDSSLFSRLLSVFVPEVREMRRTVAQADAIELRHRELRRARARRAARG
jgi:hypothetical protein